MTPLVNKAIMKRTEEIFPEELKLILASTNLMRRATSISANAIREFSTNPQLPAVMNLFARNREIVHFSMVCLMNGGYAPTKILLRAALENSLCMRLFNKRNELAKKWLVNPDKFKEKWTPKKIMEYLFAEDSKLKEGYENFYGRLCEYVHPSVKAWTEQYVEKGILYRPVFNVDYVEEGMGLIFFIIVHSFKQFIKAFYRWIPNDLIVNINAYLPEVSKMVSRHFQVK